ncbi:hypothetical protein HO173_009931 [Letharia columbiana]|uniref:C-x8-C-x5-C-x3-H type zinc finger protein n=1 Tax=Letharia columbiana TaxID=112416 RepID=A0A8H6FNL5_9LECA|nr:uncharacterized protein HO173_009931 [Letharia columbiana]KAF6231848.1 hypothetical protein HO173_009931 [Letharia columbiana]
MATEGNIALRQRYDLLKGAEHHKNALIEELLRRLDELTEDFHQEKLDHARESHFNREVQLQEIQLRDELRKYKALMDRDAFILVLIDGDGMIFDDRLVQIGEAGGREAAGLLWNAVMDHFQTDTDLPSDVKIVTRIYANLKGLGDVCKRSGILTTSSAIEDFARGFTGSKQLFDFVDVGVGKDRADDKISEIFKLHLYDSHCRRILFGCSHDNGYARLLEDVPDKPIRDQITLLEGVPFERELFQLKSTYRTTRFEGLFRATKINVYNQQYPQPPGLPPPQVQLTAGLPPYQSPYQPGIARTISASPSAPLNPAAPTWASAAMTAPSQMASPPPTPQPTANVTKQVLRNRYGQRIDTIMSYDPNEVKRIKKLKMCNVHFLRGDCPYDPCTHDHFYKPNKNEMATLKYVSRMTPCKFGSECDDLKCIYGHRCPNDVEGKKDCRWGENCRFERELHGLDRAVVKTLKVGK